MTGAGAALDAALTLLLLEHDPEKRERYDRLGQNWKAGDDVSGASGFEASMACTPSRVQTGVRLPKDLRPVKT